MINGYVFNVYSGKINFGKSTLKMTIWNMKVRKISLETTVKGTEAYFGNQDQCSSSVSANETFIYFLFIFIISFF